MPRQKKPVEAYETKALTRGLRVLLALEDGLPAPLCRVQERAAENANYCFRALCTLHINGLARETESGWQLTGKGARMVNGRA